jgi:YbbR domain-containing protein
MNKAVTRLYSRWPVRGFFRDNLGWMGISLILSVIIWVVATLETNPVLQREFPESISIKFVDNQNDGVVLLYTNTLRRTARVTLRAPRSSWESQNENERFTASDIEIYADLRDLPVGVHVVQLQARIKDDSPPGQIVSVSPSDITIEMVPLERLTLPVTFNVFSELPAEYEYTRQNCTNTNVTISGPGVQLEQVSRAVVYLNVRRPDEPLLHSGQVVLVHANNREFSQRDLEGLRIEPAQINCEIGITRIENSKTLRVDPVIAGSPPAGYLIGDRSWTPETVLVVGESDVLDALGEFVQTETIDLTGQTSSFSRTVGLVLPEGIQLRSGTTLITVNVEIQPIPTTRQFAEVPVQILNLGAAYIANVAPQSVVVTVEGPEPLVRQLMIEDLRVSIDLQGRGPGTYTGLPATVAILKESVRGAATATLRPGTLDVVISLLPTSTPQPAATPGQSGGIFGKIGVD